MGQGEEGLDDQEIKGSMNIMRRFPRGKRNSSKDRVENVMVRARIMNDLRLLKEIE